jgi:electron transfer flavoprotein alpha subunit
LLRLVLTLRPACRRPIYAGNAIATVQSGEKLKLLTIRTTAFEKVCHLGVAMHRV